MVTTFCQSRAQIINESAVIDTSHGACCPCQLCPPINEYTYCVLKRICRKILKEICNEQRREVYSVFDGGNSMKYESLGKPKIGISDHAETSSKQGRLSSSSFQRGSRQLKGKRVCGNAADARRKAKKRNSLDGDGKDKQDLCKDKSEKDRADKEKHAQSKRDSRGYSGKDKSGKNKDKDDKAKAERDRLKAEKEKFRKEAEREKALKDRNERDRLEKEKAEKERELKTRQRRSMERLSAAAKELMRAKNLQEKQRKALEGKGLSRVASNNLELDGASAKKRKLNKSLGVMPAPSRGSYAKRRAATLTRADAIRPCDLLRANMEYKEMCYPRICPPCSPCRPCQPCSSPCAPCTPRYSSCPPCAQYEPCDPCYVRCIC